VLEARDAIVQARDDARAVEVARERLMQDVLDERGLPRAGHAGDRDEEPERDLDVDVAQVVLARVVDADRLLGSKRRRSSGIAIFISPLRYLPVIDCGERAISSTVPSAITSPPCFPAPGPCR
jgi:hypothetical protein